jgi:hypothetical protein
MDYRKEIISKWWELNTGGGLPPERSVDELIENLDKAENDPKTWTELDELRYENARLELRVKELEKELSGLNSWADSVEQSLNQGDGSYRP